LDGTVNGTLTVSGAPGAKQSTLSLTGNGIRYDQLTFGSMQLQARHSGGRLGFDFRSSANRLQYGAFPVVGPPQTMTVR
jgi:autotransporter translocation and assembly factor TamB